MDVTAPCMLMQHAMRAPPQCSSPLTRLAVASKAPVLHADVVDGGIAQDAAGRKAGGERGHWLLWMHTASRSGGHWAFLCSRPPAANCMQTLRTRARIALGLKDSPGRGRHRNKGLGSPGGTVGMAWRGVGGCLGWVKLAVGAGAWAVLGGQQRKFVLVEQSEGPCCSMQGPSATHPTHPQAPLTSKS